MEPVADPSHVLKDWTFDVMWYLSLSKRHLVVFSSANSIPQTKLHCPAFPSPDCLWADMVRDPVLWFCKYPVSPGWALQGPFPWRYSPRGIEMAPELGKAHDVPPAKVQQCLLGLQFDLIAFQCINSPSASQPALQIGRAFMDNSSSSSFSAQMEQHQLC